MSFSVTSTMSPRLAGIMASAAYFAVMMRDVSPCRKIASAVFRSACQRKPYNNEMSPRRRKAEDVDVFAALVRVMLRCGPEELTLRAIAAEAGVTAGALVQRFGSKRELLHAHARHGASTGDIGFGAPLDARTASPLQAVRAATAVHARLAESPRAALRNLAYLQNDLADPVLRRHLLRLKRAGAGSLRAAGGRCRICGRTPGRYRRSGAGAHDRGHARWFFPGVDAVSGGLRC